jgi:hypothetical protein
MMKGNISIFPVGGEWTVLSLSEARAALPVRWPIGRRNGGSGPPDDPNWRGSDPIADYLVDAD